VDGYPDILLTIINDTAVPSPGGLLGGGRSSGTQAKVLQNVPCEKSVAGCTESGGGKRGWQVMQGGGWEALEAIWDAEGATWVDVDDNVSYWQSMWTDV
jgi:integrin alpha FG-GAP repeat containing protein 1